MKTLSISGLGNARDTFTKPTEKGCNTCNTLNDEFLSAVFHALPDRSQSMIVTFTGDPRAVKRGAWNASVRQKRGVMPDSANNYFALGSYYPGDDGQVRRKKSHFAACTFAYGGEWEAQAAFSPCA